MKYKVFSYLYFGLRIKICWYFTNLTILNFTYKVLHFLISMNSWSFPAKFPKRMTDISFSLFRVIWCLSRKAILLFGIYFCNFWQKILVKIFHFLKLVPCSCNWFLWYYLLKPINTSNVLMSYVVVMLCILFIIIIPNRNGFAFILW